MSNCRCPDHASVRAWRACRSLSWLRLLALCAACAAAPVAAQDAALGSNLQGLLDYARANSNELGAMRHEADAAAQRVTPAAALPDPVVRVELMNINNYGSDAAPNLLPARVGETRYTLMQALPGWGKRELRRDLAAADAAQAGARVGTTWAELAARIKTSYAEAYRASANARLTRELLELMRSLEQVALARYASGLVPQQDAVRAQLEQTAMRTELIMFEQEKRQLDARLNALLGRDAAAALAEAQQLRSLPVLSMADATSLAARTRAGNAQNQAEAARLASAQKGRELILQNRYPDFQVGVFPTQMRSRVTTWGLMFEMNIPLQKESRRAQEREAELMVSAALARSEALAQQLRGELAANLVAFDAARRTHTLQRTELLPQSQLSLQSARAAYESGKVDFATLLDAQRQIRRARQELLKSEVEAQLRLADIERVVGDDL